MTSDVDLLRDTDLLYPEHDRNSCSDESPINVEAAGSHGCERCTAIALARGEASEARANRLREEVDSLRSRLEDTTRDKLNAEARAERLAEALRPFAALDLKPGFLDTMPGDQPIFARNNSIITVGDVRRARAALQEKE